MSTVSPPTSKPPAADHEILFQQWFKSVGPRTYAAQLKKAKNGNHFLVLTEGNRDKETDQIRKTRLFLYSEDFAAFFKMLHETAVFIRENPVPEGIRKRQERRWAKNPASGGKSSPRSAAPDNRPARRPGTSAGAVDRRPEPAKHFAGNSRV